MERVIHYEIPSAFDGRRVSDFLKQKQYSRKILTRLKETPNEILLNGQKTYVSQCVHSGDRLTVHILEQEFSPHIVPEILPLAIVYEDEDILVIDKPAGMPVHPSINHHSGTLANAVAGYYASRKIPYVFRCVNRLDRDTSGLVLLAKHMLSGAILSKEVREGNIHREYRAIVCGQLPKEGCICAPIGRKPGSIIERQIDQEHGSPAVTHYQTLQYKNGYSHVSIWLETGRTHQIRVHMKSIGHPLPGDFLYYPDFTKIKRQALHSYRLSFVHPIHGTFMEFRSDLPEDMKSML